MDRCSSSTEMPRLMQRTFLIWPTPRNLHLFGTSSAQALGDPSYMITPFSLPAMKASGRYRHRRQSPPYPMHLLIKACCPRAVTQLAAAAAHQMAALPSRLILGYGRSSRYFLR